MQGPETKSTREAGQCEGQNLGGLHLQGAEPGTCQAAALWEECAGEDLEVEQRGHGFAAQFCGSYDGGAGFLDGAFVGAGVDQAFGLFLVGRCGGKFLAEMELCRGGMLHTTAVLMSNDSLEGLYGGRAREQEMLGGYGVFGDLDGKDTEEIGLSLGGLPDNFAGHGGDDVLEGFDAGQTASPALTKEHGMVEGLYGGPLKFLEEHGFSTGGLHDGMAGVEGFGVLEGFGAGLLEGQAVAAELGATEGLGGIPPDPGGGAWGLLCWHCLRPSWRQGLRGVRVGEASHPGPGGGAAATEHRRQEHQMQQARSPLSSF